ncbi:hypothetical protein like AT3G09510 [Hibiscus trionum]|uniref:Reverse transcriptase n=1 Tax=Hibiscus trionum TaxID=183268 RepID=A0A9W7ICX9_HIBTR|nr:hypothetical protein like AT3G09510 [Hibiscus trionum]
MVSDLIDRTNMTWKVDLVKESFSPSEAEEILCIPLSMFSQNVSLVWSGEHSGIYSVRSWYRMLLPDSVIANSDKALFKKIWQVDCPTKMNIQCWKFLKNLVPTKLNLCTRIVTTDPTCFRCLQSPENVAHVLRNCPFADQVWARVGIHSPTIDEQSSFSEWLSKLLSNISNNKSTEVLITIWALWTAQNKFIFEGEQKNPTDIVTSIKSYSLDLRLVSDCLTASNPRACIRWLAPADPFVKVNFDVGFRQHEKSATIGVIIRNMEGQILGASSLLAYHIPSTFAAEAQAAICGLRLAADMGFRQIEVEGDSRAVVTKLQSDSDDPSDIGALISEAKGQTRRFQECRFLFRHRSRNRVAHALAALRRSLDTDLVWIEEAPVEIETLAAEDRRWLDPP